MSETSSRGEGSQGRQGGSLGVLERVHGMRRFAVVDVVLCGEVWQAEIYIVEGHSRKST